MKGPQQILNDELKYVGVFNWKTGSRCQVIITPISYLGRRWFECQFEVRCRLVQSLQTNCQLIPQNRSRPLPFTSFPIRLPQTLLPIKLCNLSVEERSYSLTANVISQAPVTWLEVLTAVKITLFFCVVAPCKFVGWYQCFRETLFLQNVVFYLHGIWTQKNIIIITSDVCRLRATPFVTPAFQTGYHDRGLCVIFVTHLYLRLLFQYFKLGHSHFILYPLQFIIN